MRHKKVVSKGFNKLKTHPKIDGFIHAEQDAILNAREKCDELIVVRVSKSGKLRCSKPCNKCVEFLRAHGIEKVYYIDWDGEIQAMRL
jgi:deoxycytidylate deaminase